MSIRKSLLVATALSAAVASGGAWATTFFHRAPISGMASPNPLDTSGGGATPTPTPEPAAPDTTPNAFAIAAVSGATRGAVVSSAAVAPSGFDTATAISVSGDPTARISIAGGPAVQSGTLAPGQSFTVSLMSAAAASTSSSATVTVGGVASTWSVTTSAADSKPDAFTIPAVAGAAGTTTVTSDAVTPVGYTDAAPISVEPGGVSVNGGPFVGSTTINPGQSFRVSLMTGIADGTAYTANVSIGGTSAAWNVTTGDQTPDAFSVPALTAQAPSTVVTSSPVTITGIDMATPIVLSGGAPGATVSVAGGAYASSGTISNGQSLTLRITTPAGTAEAQTQNVIASIGGRSATWSVGTRALKTAPDPFSFQAQSDVKTGSNPVSNEVTISGLDAPAPFAVTSTASNYGVYVNGGRSYVASGTVNNGDKIKALVAASTEPSTTTSATVTIGGVNNVFSVTTEAPDSTPDPFTIATASGVAGNTLWTSPSFTPTGVNSSMAASVTGQGTPKLSLGSGQAASGTLPRNTSTFLILSLGAEDGTTYAGTVTIGGVAAPYSVTVKDKVPDAFSVPALTGQTTGTVATSASVTPTGYADATTISVTGDGSPTIDVNGDGNFQSSRTIAPGQSFRVRMTNSASGGATSNAVVSVGGVNATFSSTTVTAAPVASCPGQAEFYGYGRFCQVIPAGCNSGITYTIGSGGQMGGGGAGGQTVCVDVTPNGSGACYAIGFTWCTGNTNIYLRMNWN